MNKRIKKIYYLVAFEANKVHSHWNGAIAVSVQCFDVVQKVCKELIAAFEHTQGNNVVSSHILHDFSGQSLSPAGIGTH